MSIYDGGQISKQERDRPLPTVTSSWQTTKNRSVNKPEHQSVSQAGRQSSSWKAVCPETLKHLCPLLVRPVSLGPIWTWTVCSDVDIQTPGCFKASHWFWRIGDLASFFCFAFSPLKACHWAGQGGRGGQVCNHLRDNGPARIQPPRQRDASSGTSASGRGWVKVLKPLKS